MLAKVVMRAQVSLSIRRVRRYRSKFASALGHTHDEGESGGRRDPADTGVLVSCRELLSAGWDGFGLAAGCWWDVKRRFWYFWTSWVVCSGLEAICSVVQGWVPVKKKVHSDLGAVAWARASANPDIFGSFNRLWAGT